MTTQTMTETEKSAYADWMAIGRYGRGYAAELRTLRATGQEGGWGAWGEAVRGLASHAATPVTVDRAVEIAETAKRLGW